MTNTIIQRVHQIAKDQGAPEGMNFGGFDNETVILDIDTSNIPTEDDDDDASDRSYSSDEDTVETELTEIASDDDEFSNTEVSPAFTKVNANNVDINEEETNEPNHAPDDQSIASGEINPTSDDANELEEQTAEEEGLEVENEDVPDVAIRQLRPIVKSRNYDSSEGYESTTRTRESNNFFCSGYANAVRSLERDHEAIMLVGAAVEQYNNLEASLVTPQYGVNKGLRIFGKNGTKALLKELKQLDDLEVIEPHHPRQLTAGELRKALPYLMFLKRKRCGKIKARGCADGRSQREFISKDEASSPTASLHAIMLSCLVDAIEERSVGIVDIPGAFLQTEMPEDEKVHVRLTGAMADILIGTNPNKYKPCAVKNRKGETVLFGRARKAIYGTLKAALLFWKKLRKELGDQGFKPNPYDPCVMNKMINNAQATVVWYVDDLKISHTEESVVKEIITDLNHTFGTVSELTGHVGKVHEYLGMTIDYSTQSKVRFSMIDYLQDIIENLPKHLQTNRNTTSPAADHLFTTNPSAEKLDEEQADEFHHYVAKLLFAAKRARPDIQTAVAFLCTRVKAPDSDDQKKLIRLLGYIRETIFLTLTLGWDGTGNLYWYVDAAFGVHDDMKSHTGGVLTLGTGAAISMSTKQKINTKSSTEAELVGVDDTLPHNIWCRNFLKAQGYHAGQSEDKEPKFIGHTNILYQDNTSSIRLEVNGRASSSKRTRHISIRYFMVADRLKQGDISTITHCPTDEMISDYLTKPLQGAKFRKFRNAIMGISDAEYIRQKVDYERIKSTCGSLDYK